MPRKGDFSKELVRRNALSQQGQSFRGGADGRRFAVFLCDCGRRKIMDLENVKSGRSKTCGCSARKPKSHGKCGSLTYVTWAAMKQRCAESSLNPQYYRDKGISVCERWKNSFEAFVADMGERPSKQHSIDRIDSNGNYEPGNCRWATIKEQNRNTSANVILTHNGKTMCMTDWAIELGVETGIIADRLRLGWSVERALTSEKRTKGKPKPQWMAKRNRWRARIVVGGKEHGLGWHKTEQEAQAAIDRWIEEQS